MIPSHHCLNEAINIPRLACVIKISYHIYKPVYWSFTIMFGNRSRRELYKIFILG